MHEGYIIYFYLTDERKYQENCSKNHQRCIRRKAKNFIVKEGTVHTHICPCITVHEGRLYYIGHGQQHRLVIESNKEKHRIIKSIHEDGHLGKSIFVTHCSELEIGIVKVAKAITTKYYWEKSMQKDIIKYIKSCDKCQRSKPKLRKCTGSLHPIPVSSKVHCTCIIIAC